MGRRSSVHNMVDATTEVDYDVLIIGAGLSGIAAACLLKSKAGLRVRVLEAKSGAGGTWFWNRYPGCRFDSESWSYGFSFLEEVLEEWEWTEHFAAQPETLRYVQFLVKKLDLEKDMQFDTRVKSASYQDRTRSWLLEDSHGAKYSSRFLVTATGVLGEPVLPKLKGMKNFRGTSFHTARWPDNFCVSGRRIGVIGTGASGIQVIQSIAKKDPKSLTVFQRSPNWSAPLHNSPIDADEMRAIRKRYPHIFEQCMGSHFSFIHEKDPRNTFDVPEAERIAFWEELYRRPGFAKWLGNFGDVNSDQRANDLYSGFIASKIRERVKDQKTAEKLIPKDHGFGTKRVPLETRYFEAYNNDNVRLVDLLTEASIDWVTESGIQLSTGEHIDLDVIVYATGFDTVAAPFFAIDIKGSDGVSLHDLWKPMPKTYLGMFVHRLPNFMMVMGPHQMFGNLPRGVEFAAAWIAEFVKYCTERGITYAEATQEQEEQWTEHVESQISGLLLNNAKEGSYGVGKHYEVLLRYNGPAEQYRQKCIDVAEGLYKDFVFRKD